MKTALAEEKNKATNLIQANFWLNWNLIKLKTTQVDKNERKQLGPS